MHKKTRSTKQALLLSLLALLTCLSMFVGSTYAWYTDAVTSGNNVIQAGHLKVGFEKWNGFEWVDVSATPIFQYDKWEPGYTQTVNLRVVNQGNLSLKWEAAITTEKTLSELADAICVYVRSDDRNDTVREYIRGVDSDDLDTLAEQGQFKKFTLRQFITDLSVMTKGTLEPEQESYLGLILRMDPYADNKYQDLDLGGKFDLLIVATQHTDEADSFGTTYDQDAAYQY